jgi:ribose transport system permease protein
MSATATEAPTAHARLRWRAPEETGIFLVFLIVVIGISLLSPSFRSYQNALTLLLNGAVIAFLALGQTMVLLTGGIDLSAGSNVAMTGVFAAYAMSQGASWPVASAIALAIGALMGTINGILVHYARIPAFIVTFATMGAASSIPFILTQAKSITVTDPGFAWVGQGRILSVPVPVVLLLVVAVIVGVVLNLTRFGVQTYAVGGNAVAARLAGVNIARVTLTVYAMSGLFAGFGGLILTSRLMVGYPSAGTGNELFFSIAAAVVGGVSLFGGTGSVPGAMIGAVLIATVSNGLNVMNISSYWQPLVVGLIILGGVGLDTYRRNRSGRPLPPFLRRLFPAKAGGTPIEH